MKAATVTEIKKELAHKSAKELTELCLNLSKFKKENKELLTYLLFESSNEMLYIQGIKYEVDTEFNALNKQNFYRYKKGLRKILRTIKKYIRYSKKKDTEADLLLYFCTSLKTEFPRYTHYTQLSNMFDMQLKLAKKAISNLHEDLQYDFNTALEELEG